MRFKVGDRVQIKSLDWYNENKDPKHEYVDCGNGIGFYKHMTEYCGKVMTISEIWDCYYDMEGHVSAWNDEMIEGLVEEESEKKLSNESWRYKNVFDHSQYPQSFECPEGYIFKDENGNVINATKIVLEKKKKEYPKTYEECCKILGLLNVDLCFNAEYRSFNASKEQWKRLGLMNQFYQLLICRDAYWKIAGEEMGLGKPWEPDFDNLSTNLEYMKINKGCFTYSSRVFAFPTPEMRDAFKENFDPDIEICKELL